MKSGCARDLLGKRCLPPVKGVEFRRRTLPALFSPVREFLGGNHMSFIFLPELIIKIVNEDKTQTRRLALPEPDGTGCAGTEMLRYPNGQLAVCRGAKDDSHWRTRWQVGKEYSVVPGRGKFAIWWTRSYLSGAINFAHETGGYKGMNTWEQFVDLYPDPKVRKHHMLAFNWKPLKIRILNLWREDVRQISEVDAKAEGFEDTFGFLKVWTKLHDKAGFTKYPEYGGYRVDGLTNVHDWGESLEQRPDDRYRAWAIQFELVK